MRCAAEIGTGGETPPELAGEDACGPGEPPRAGAGMQPPRHVINTGLPLHRVGIYARVRAA